MTTPRKCLKCGAYFEDEYPFDICPKDRVKPKQISLAKLHAVFKKWLWIEDTGTLDMVLATALSHTLPYGEPPIWIIVVGPSGDGKSEILNSLAGSGWAMRCDRLTSKSLISGYKSDSGETFDLAPELNGKVWIISDFAQLLKLHPNEKGEVWAQLRNLYDGTISSKSGTRTLKEYDNLRVTLLGGSTPAINQQILIFQDLGTRELIWRTIKVKNSNKRFCKIDTHYGKGAKMKTEMATAMRQYFQGRTVRSMKIPKTTLQHLQKLANFLAILRSTADTDWYTGELVSPVSTEEPTRIYSQFRVIYKALRSLAPDYSDRQARIVLARLVLSNCNPLRLALMQIIGAEADEIGYGQLIGKLKKARKTILTECMVLADLGLLNARNEEMTYGKSSWWFCKNQKLIEMLSAFAEVLKASKEGKT
jgi:hypothetical protein